MANKNFGTRKVLFQKEKLLMLVKEVSCEASEYVSMIRLTSVFYAASSNAFAKLVEVIKNTKSAYEAERLIRHAAQYYESQGHVALETKCFESALKEFQAEIQIGYTKQFRLFSSNSYEDTYSSAIFCRNDSLQYDCQSFRPRYADSLEHIWFGSSAGGKTFADYLREINACKIIVSQNDGQPMNIRSDEFVSL